MTTINIQISRFGAYGKIGTNNGGKYKYVYAGIPFKKELLENLGAEEVVVDLPRQHQRVQ